MKSLISALVVTVALALSGVAAAEKQSNPSLRSAAHRVAAFQRATWGCQDRLNAPRTKASVHIWALPKSLKYRKWAGSLWRTRANRCKQVLARRTIPYTNDWQTAVRIVQRVYPGTSGWMLYISHREGGYGGFVMNHQGSGAGGWMQFMAGTYYGYSDDAFADARRRGFILDEHWNSWSHPLGQALTAGYMRFTGRDGCHWCL